MTMSARFGLVALVLGATTGCRETTTAPPPYSGPPPRASNSRGLLDDLPEDAYAVVGVSDGDTLTVSNGKEQIKVRLWGVDAPEKDQAYGQQSKKFTSDQVYGQVVRLEVKNRDRYGRSVSIITGRRAT